MRLFWFWDVGMREGCEIVWCGLEWPELDSGWGSCWRGEGSWSIVFLEGVRSGKSHTLFTVYTCVP